jgi:hypothetical protein
MLALADFERRASVHRAAIAEAEAELHPLVLFVPPLVHRKPNPHFAPGELSRLCCAVFRNRGGVFLAIDQVTVGVMRAKGLNSRDIGLRRPINQMVNAALRRMRERGSVAKRGRGSGARWGLP